MIPPMLFRRCNSAANKKKIKKNVRTSADIKMDASRNNVDVVPPLYLRCRGRKRKKLPYFRRVAPYIPPVKILPPRRTSGPYPSVEVPPENHYI